MAWHERVLDFLRDLLRFGVAGSIVAVVQTGLYIGLVDFRWTGPVTASVVAFVAGTAVSFTVHYNWTFNSSRKARRAFWRFGLARLAGLAVNTGGVWATTKALGLSHYWGLVFMLVITPLTVFTISKFWAFRDTPHFHEKARES